jgi:hypothetical protein
LSWQWVKKLTSGKTIAKPQLRIVQNSQLLHAGESNLICECKLILTMKQKEINLCPIGLITAWNKNEIKRKLI